MFVCQRRKKGRHTSALLITIFCGYLETVSITSSSISSTKALQNDQSSFTSSKKQSDVFVVSFYDPVLHPNPIIVGYSCSYCKISPFFLACIISISCKFMHFFMFYLPSIQRSNWISLQGSLPFDLPIKRLVSGSEVYSANHEFRTLKCTHLIKNEAMWMNEGG